MSKREQPRQNDDELPTLDVRTPPQYETANIKFGLQVKKPYLIVLLSDTDKTGIIDGNEKEGYFIRIDPGKHWRIKFTLDREMWDWSFDKDPISFKDKYHSKYYKVISQKADELVIEAMSTHPKPDPNQQSPDEVNHPFNLYVLMHQSTKKVYPMTIDPDVKNPPRGGGRKGPITAMAVPLG